MNLLKNKFILTAVIIAGAAIVWFLFIQNGLEQSPTPKTSQEIQEEIRRLEEEKIRLEEDIKKVEEGEVACILIYDPICGADGRTYSNSCFAGAAGVDIAHQGECI